ncbi:MBL fold metallo-hydrolase [Paenibacillus sp. FSL A5-0031]|uniref:MBL fold metallo-hydrolase n=1 Tax=unclassified Paenibacillus TaxID=185978 RepID=UPI00096FFFB6|nr:MBL fold metallo-hydrolase [Paenibacillus sp. FSL A5-0031]OME85071.1 MBL fold metallo-hydrolase [Paenibacillus sp. FSL A5-0031]
MNIASGVNMMPISAVMMGRMETIYPTLIWDNDTVILVDTGYPGQLPLIKEQMERAGLAFERLNKIIITHQDLDHIGSLPAILQELPHKAEVLADKVEAPYIQGEAHLLKVTPESIEQAVKALPAEVPEEWRAAFRKTLENPPKANVDVIITDGQQLPYCGGIIVIGTPGHTPGHLSLYHTASKTLIAADALIVENDQLLGPTPHYCLDPDTAKKSIKKLTQYDINTVICYHGGLYSDHVNERILELAAE